MKGGSEITILLFKMEKCGHCIQFKPIWNQLIKNHENLNFKEHDAVIDEEIIRNYKIEGYPTIMIEFKNEQKSTVVEFTHERTYDNLVEFIKSDWSTILKN